MKDRCAKTLMVSPTQVNADFMNDFYRRFIGHCAHKPDEVYAVYEELALDFNVSLFDGRKIGPPQSGDGDSSVAHAEPSLRAATHSRTGCSL